jgi:hypothetical protein
MFDKSRNTGSYAEVDVTKQTVDKANSANLLDILNHYNINIDAYSRKSPCPFPFHKGGHERSASFYYYPDSNSFYCFGCKSGGSPADFVALYENVNRYNAAITILNNFSSNPAHVVERHNNYDKIYLEFSHLIREFIMEHRDDTKAFDYAEYVCAAFDNVRNKYTLDPDGLNVIYTKLKRKLEEFK